MTDHDMPCGRCDVGIYSYAAMFAPLARTLAAQQQQERRAPRCKSMDRDCVGACHFIEALNRDPEGWKAMDEECSHGVMEDGHG